MLSFYIPSLLEKFFSILEDLETILPEDVITSFYIDLNSSEIVKYYKDLLDLGVEEEKAKEVTAYMDSVKKETFEGFLYEILNSWS